MFKLSAGRPLAVMFLSLLVALADAGESTAKTRAALIACTAHYADVKGVHTYYERCGKGPTLLLLHGAAQLKESWAPLVAKLRTRFTLIIPERRGVGRTADIEGAWTYAGFADETAAFMDKLGLKRALVFGLSDGGNIGLILASHRPDLVQRLVVSGANYNSAGFGPVESELKRMTVEDFAASAPPEVQAWIVIQRRVSPDKGAALLKTFEKMKRMWVDYEISDAELAAIKAPTLVLVGDRDMFSVPYTVEQWKKIPNAALGIIPNADHFWVLTEPALASDLIGDFLTRPHK